MSINGVQNLLSTGCASTRGSYRFNWSRLEPSDTQQRVPTLLACLVTSLQLTEAEEHNRDPAGASLLEEHRESQSQILKLLNKPGFLDLLHARSCYAKEACKITVWDSSSQKSASKHLHCCTLQHFLASPTALVS